MILFFLTKALPCILSNPCVYGSTCTNNNLSGYSCSCLTGYTGTNCQYRKFVSFFQLGVSKGIIFFVVNDKKSYGVYFPKNGGSQTPLYYPS